MDIGEASLRKDIESLRRQMRDREVEHSREVDGVRENAKASVKDLEENQKQTIAKIRRDTDEQFQDRQKRTETSNQKLQDSFEKQIEAERREHYDKFGRYASDINREKSRENVIKAKQVQDLIEGHQKEIVNRNKEREETLEKTRRAYEKNRADNHNYLNKKIDEERASAEEEHAKMAMASRNKIDDHIRRSSSEVEKLKLGADLKYEKLVRDKEMELDNFKKGAKTREKQLVDAKTEIEQKVGDRGQKTFEGYRERVNDELLKTINDNNFYNNKKAQEHASNLARAETNHHNNEQLLKAQLQKVENENKFKQQAEIDRNELNQAINDRRNKQQLFLATEEQRKNDQFERDTLKSRYQEHLSDVEKKNQDQIYKAMLESRKSQNELDARNNGEKNQLQRKFAAEISAEHLRSNREKQEIIDAYSKRMNATDDLKTRQLEEQKQAHLASLQDKNHKTEKAISNSNRENQAKVWMLQDKLVQTTRENDEVRRAENQASEDIQRQKAKRLTETYARSLNKTKDQYDEINSEMSHENMVRENQFRLDRDHQMRMQALDLQNKNRLTVYAYESKINSLKEEHQVEIEKVKDEYEKQLRETLKRTKETLDQDRLAHTKEIEAKDHATKEKLKFQELAFKDQIEKIKRTNELALKKN